MAAPKEFSDLIRLSSNDDAYLKRFVGTYRNRVRTYIESFPNYIPEDIRGEKTAQFRNDYYPAYNAVRSVTASPEEVTQAIQALFNKIRADTQFWQRLTIPDKSVAIEAKEAKKPTLPEEPPKPPTPAPPKPPPKETKKKTEEEEETDEENREGEEKKPKDTKKPVQPEQPQTPLSPPLEQPTPIRIPLRQRLAVPFSRLVNSETGRRTRGVLSTVGLSAGNFINRISPPIATNSTIIGGITGFAAAVGSGNPGAAGASTAIGGAIGNIAGQVLARNPGITSSGARGVGGFFRGNGGLGSNRFSFPQLPGGKKKRTLLLRLLLGFAAITAVVLIFFPDLLNFGQKKEPLVIEKMPLKGSVENGQKIDYLILVKNNNPSKADSQLSDVIPKDTEYIAGSATGGPVEEKNQSGKVIKLVWQLKEFQPGETRQFTFSVIPLKKDTWIENQAEGKVASLVGLPAPPGGKQVDPQSVSGINDFNTLMRGQGRNIAVLGSEDEFVSKVSNNGSQYVTGKEEYLRKVYKKAVSRNVNPLAVLVHWGTETGFSLDLQNKAFSCPVGVATSFDEQVSCSSNTFDNWMRYFEQNNTDGKLALNDKCIYDDPYIFATEKYGPTCVVYDGNDHYLSNFVKFYKQFLGAK
ncbi:DUF11 domain-containing protein [Candidatus Daviesbacteria bacterium]|nr:DUF11 domain-containing protein [Candidatus Daviesbacteria bacterium]